MWSAEAESFLREGTEGEEWCRMRGIKSVLEINALGNCFPESERIYKKTGIFHITKLQNLIRKKLCFFLSNFVVL